MDDEEALAAAFANLFALLDARYAHQLVPGMHTARTGRDEIEKMMRDPRITSAVIARAACIGTELESDSNVARRHAQFAVYLQRKLTEEHVAAQERMTRAADRLASASWGLAAVSLALAIATYWKTFH
jgi:hypothetical protein